MLCSTVHHMECLEGNKLVICYNYVEFITKQLTREKMPVKGLVGYIQRSTVNCIKTCHQKSNLLADTIAGTNLFIYLLFLT